MSKVKTITLSTYNTKYGEDPTAPLYVVNTSDGRLTLNILNDQNRADTAVVPVSFAPIDLTAIAPRVNCLTNTTFKRFINRRFLAVVDNASVEEALKKDPALLEEFNRVNNGGVDVTSEELVLNTSNAAKDKPDNVARSSNQKLDGLLMECQAAEAADKTERSGLVKDICTMFRRSVNQFSAEDLEEFIDQCKTSEVADLAIERLSEMTE